jgi:hypothetical protein
MGIEVEVAWQRPYRADVEHKREQSTTCSIECFNGGNLIKLEMW